MSDSLLAKASKFGSHRADSPTGPIPLVRLGDLPPALAGKRSLSLLEAANAVCDRLGQLDYASTHGFREAFPEVETPEEFERLRFAIEGLQLYRMRQGFAERICRDTFPLESETWRTGDTVPAGYELRPGRKPCPWDAFRESSLVRPEQEEHIVWVWPGNERRRGSPFTWIDELNLHEQWERCIESFGSCVLAPTEY